MSKIENIFIIHLYKKYTDFAISKLFPLNPVHAYNGFRKSKFKIHLTYRNTIFLFVK